MTEMVETLINGRWPLLLPEHRAARPEWDLANGGWERERLDAMADRIGPSDVVFYCGSEEGEFPALCQIWGAEVALFEPNPKVWANTKAIWDANKLHVPVCWPGFASNETRDLGAELRQAWPECASGKVVGDHGFKELHLEAANYPQIRIDDAVAQWKPPTVVCFDVEGSEFELLRGAEQTLHDHRPALFASIHPEFLYAQWGEYSRDLRNWIVSLGYQETILAYEHELHALYEPVRQENLPRHASPRLASPQPATTDQALSVPGGVDR